VTKESILLILFLKMQEYLIKKGDRIEVMAMLGVFGAIISAIQMYPSIVNLSVTH
jgi:Solute carrier family 35